MKWKTSITSVNNGQEIIRGIPLKKLVAKHGFVSTIWLLLKGVLPKKNEITMLDALMTMGIDHGVGTASALNARITASAGNSLTTAVASGILAMGEKHGGAVESAARFFQENESNKNITNLLRTLKEKSKRIPGYGHKVLNKDKRSEQLLRLAKKNKIHGKYCILAKVIEKELNKTSSKKLPLNIDGAIAAIISDMGFDWRIANGFFVISRTPGLVAHVYEELTSNEGLRRLDESEIVYTGPKSKKS